MRRADPPAPPDPGPVLRRALRRATDADIGIDSGLSEGKTEVANLVALLDSIDQGDLVIALEREGDLAGAVLLKPAFWRSVVEQKTLGRIMTPRMDERGATGTDAALCVPLLSRFLAELEAMKLDQCGWCAGLTVGSRVELPRILELSLPVPEVNSLSGQCRFGPGGEESLLQIFAVSPPPADENDAPVEPSGPLDGWSDVALHLPAALQAILHRMELSLASLRTMAPGDVIPLDGADLGHLRLEAPDGKLAAMGRLGRLGALRAMRVERPPEAQMEEVSLSFGGEDPAALALTTDGLTIKGSDAALPDAGAQMDPIMDLPDMPGDMPAEPMAAPDGLGDLDGLGEQAAPLPDLEEPGGLPDMDLPDMDLEVPAFDPPESEKDTPDDCALPDLVDLPDMGELPEVGGLPDLGDCNPD